MRILDTHLHLIYPERFSYPWLVRKPTLNRPWSLEDYFAEARGLGIDSALHMEVDVREEDIEGETAFVSTLPGIAGAIAACRPEAEDFAARLDRILEAGNGRVRGLRRILHEAPDELSQTPLFAENLRHIAGKGLPFDLCLRTDQLHLGVRLARLVPELTFVLDHCGNPEIDDGDTGPWWAAMEEIAALPNVMGKVSGLINHCEPGWTVATLRPYVEHVINCFGWDRVVWGSDHPVVRLGGTLTQWVEATREIVATATPAQQAKLFHVNAERIYRL